MTKEFNNYPDSPSDQITFKEIILEVKEWINFLLSKWLTIVIFGILGGALGLTYAYFKKNIYSATTTFVLEEEKSGGGLSSLAGLASMAGVDLGSGGGNIFQGDNIIELYKSRKMIEKTLLSSMEGNKDELLIDRYILSNELKSKWLKDENLRDIRFNSNEEGNRLKDSIISKIVEDISKDYLSVTKPDKKLSIIKVVVKSNDEVFAKEFNEQIVKNVNDFYVQTKTKKSLENVNILQVKTDSIRSVMNGAIYNAAAVADATPNLNPTRQVQRAAPVQRSQFSAETNKLILGELVKNLEMSKIALRKETPLIQVIDSPQFPLEMSKFGKLKGILLGGILLGFLTILFLILKRIYIKAIHE